MRKQGQPLPFPFELPRATYCTVSFSVSGFVHQNVTILDRRVTPRSLEEGLRTGKYFTTVQEGEDICDANGRAVARVDGLSHKSDLEYDDFEVL